MILGDEHFFFPTKYSQNNIKDGVETVFFLSNSYENLNTINDLQLQYMFDIMTNLRHKLFFSTGRREIITDVISNAIRQYNGSNEQHQQQQGRYNETQEKKWLLFDKKFDGATSECQTDQK